MDTTPLSHPTLGCLLHLLPAVTASHHFCLGVCVSCGPGSSPPLPLWVPGHSHTVFSYTDYCVSVPCVSVSCPVGSRSQPCSLQLHRLLCLCAMWSWVFPCGFQITAIQSSATQTILCLCAMWSWVFPLWIPDHSHTVSSYTNYTVSLCHVFLGLPLFLFPCGFQVTA